MTRKAGQNYCEECGRIKKEVIRLGNNLIANWTGPKTVTISQDKVMGRMAPTLARWQVNSGFVRAKAKPGFMGPEKKFTDIDQWKKEVTRQLKVNI